MATTEKETDRKKPLTLSRPGRLELRKTVEGGQVKQSFSHGRSKTVTVEVKKKRTFRQNAGGEMTEVKATPEPVVEPEAPAQQQVEEPVREMPPARTLTETEQATRVRALEDARKAAEEARVEAEQRALVETERAAAEPESETIEPPDVAEEAPATKTLEELRREEEEARRAVEEEAARTAEAAAQRAAEMTRRRVDTEIETSEEAPSRGKGRGAARAEARPSGAKPGTERRRRLTWIAATLPW